MIAFGALSVRRTICGWATVALAGLVALPTPAQSPGTVIRVGPSRVLQRISQAVPLAVDSSVVEIDAGDYVADVAVWDHARLTLRGVGGRVRLVAAGASAEGKAIWVIRRGVITVENIEFVGASVLDRNGAGIRLEGGHLVVRGCRFLDSENGILTGNDPATRLEVENSEFGHLGAGDGFSHGIYVGAIGSFRLSGSYVHHSKVGHLVKSRARYNRIEYNRLTDEPGGSASYELEFPNGGVAEVVGNIVQQVADTRNAVIVSYGTEGYTWPRNALSLVHNTVINDEGQGARFLRVMPGADAVLLRNNLWVGPGRVDGSSVADAAGDRRAQGRDLVQPLRGDYRPSGGANAAWSKVALASVPAALLPRLEYQHPLATRPLAGVPRWPGALQPAGP